MDLRPTPELDTIVLVHGLWMTSLSWENWIKHYEGLGFTTVAPTWPGFSDDIAALRRDPSAMEGLGFSEVVDHYERIIRALPKPPLIIGHSFGGGVAQVLLDRGLGAAGVAVNSGPVKGVYGLPLSALRSVIPVLANPLNVKKAVPLTPRQFHYAITNELDERASREVYDRYHVPGAARVLFQGALANFRPGGPTKVDFHKRDRAPLLLIAGGADHIVPASMNRENYRRYRSGRVDYREFPGRTHHTVGQKGWEEVATYALKWALDVTRKA
ncbi:alpha/beta fold hydrolase [Actinosynnema sp. NPDC050436]|uniref:alpha/beta hydrolase n=1 Tax=Actinosynnema sp. NPDC050436 TaxID=3155659 RepID=UPI0033FB7A5D